MGLPWARIELLYALLYGQAGGVDVSRRALRALRAVRGWACLGRELNSCMPYFTACLGRELNSCMPYLTAKLAGVDVPRRPLRALRLGRELGPGRAGGEGVHTVPLAGSWRAGGRSGTGEAGVLSNSKPAIKATLRNTTSGRGLADMCICLMYNVYVYYMYMYMYMCMCMCMCMCMYMYMYVYMYVHLYR